MNNFKKIEQKSKPNLKRGKDEMTSFIDAEFNKFKKMKNEDPVALAVGINSKNNGDINLNLLTNMKINTNYEKEKHVESSLSTYSKFPSFSMPEKSKEIVENTMLNVSSSDFIKSTQLVTRCKTPFVMKKFENLENTKEKFITKEIIEDLEKNKNVIF